MSMHGTYTTRLDPASGNTVLSAVFTSEILKYLDAKLFNEVLEQFTKQYTAEHYDELVQSIDPEKLKETIMKSISDRLAEDALRKLTQ